MTAPPNPGRGGGHRAPGSSLKSAFGRRLGGLLLLVAGLAVGGAITTFTPDVERQLRPFPMAGTVGQAVEVRTFKVTVLDVRFAAKVKQGQKAYETTGVWVVASIRATALHETARIGYAALRDRDGVTYRASSRVDQPIAEGSRALQPGIPVDAQIVFEMPKEKARGLVLLLAEPHFDTRLDAMGEIPLPVDQATLDAALAATEPIEIVKPTVVP